MTRWTPLDSRRSRTDRRPERSRSGGRSGRIGGLHHNRLNDLPISTKSGYLLLRLALENRTIDWSRHFNYTSVDSQKGIRKSRGLTICTSRLGPGLAQGFGGSRVPTSS